MRFIYLQINRGLYDPEKDEVTIDTAWRGNPIKTFLHELLHKIHPDWRETPALHREDYIWPRLTAEQKVLLGKKLFNRRWRYKNGVCYSVRG